MSAGTVIRSAPAPTRADLHAEAQNLWDGLPERLDAATYARVIAETDRAIQERDQVRLRLAYLEATPVQAEPSPTFIVPVHDCRDESVRELDGWRFDGWRCRYCLRRTDGPGRGLVATDSGAAS